MRRQLRKTVSTVAFTVALAASLVACGQKTDTSSKVDTNTEVSEAVSENTELKELRLGSGDATNNELIDLAKVAQRNGYLEEELNKVGYTLKVTGFAGQGPEIIAALASGSLDGGDVGEFPIFTSNASGIGNTVIAISDTNLAYSILATSDEIKTVSDLEGKKIVVQAGTALQYVWEQIVADAGLDTSKIEVINSNVVDGISLVQTGDADAILSSAISISSLVDKGLGHAIDGIPESVRSTTLITLSNSFLEENPEVAVAINKALIRTYDYVIENPEAFFEAAGSTYGESGVEIAEEAYTIEGGLEYISPEFTDELTAYFDKTYNWMNDNKLVSAEVDVDTVFNSSYYEQAVEELNK